MDIKGVTKLPEYNLSPTTEASERGRRERAAPNKNQQRRQRAVTETKLADRSWVGDAADGSSLSQQIIDTLNVVKLLSTKPSVAFESIRKSFKVRAPKTRTARRVDRRS